MRESIAELYVVSFLLGLAAYGVSWSWGWPAPGSRVIDSIAHAPWQVVLVLATLQTIAYVGYGLATLLLLPWVRFFCARWLSGRDWHQAGRRASATWRAMALTHDWKGRRGS